MENKINNSLPFKMALYMAPKKKFVKRLGENNAEKIMRTKAELKTLANDVDIFVKPNFNWIESNWLLTPDYKNIQAIEIKVRKKATNLQEKFKNLILDFNPFNRKGCSLFFVEQNIFNPKPSFNEENIIKTVKKLKSEI